MEVVENFFQIISGAINQPRDWNSFKKLFAAGAVLSASVRNNSNDFVINSWSVDSYIERLEKFFQTTDFYEKAENIIVNHSINIAQVSCIYIASKNENFSPELKRGLNHIHLIKENNEWKIINTIWEDD